MWRFTFEHEGISDEGANEMRRVMVTGALIALCGGVAYMQAQNAQTGAEGPPQVPGTTAQQAVDAAAEALGGANRLRAVRNITLQGYAQYAYQNGGGNISPL